MSSDHIQKMEAQLQSRFVKIGDDDIFLRTAGNPTGPPVFLVHQIASNSSGEEWSWLVKPLADRGYFVILPDLPGFGKSSGYKVSINTEELISICIKETCGLFTSLLKLLGIPSAVFIGYDWGATVLVHYAVRAPRRISRGILFHSTKISPLLKCERIKQPFLVLWINPDQMHPVAMARATHKKLPRSDLHIVRGGVYSSRKAAHNYKSLSPELSSIILRWLDPHLVRWEERQQVAPPKEQSTQVESKVGVCAQCSGSCGIISYRQGEEEPVIPKEDILAVFKGVVSRGLDRGADLASVFQVMDKHDGSGKVTFEELRDSIEDLQIEADEEELERLMKAIDTSNRGFFTYVDFWTFIQGEKADPTVDGLSMAKELVNLMNTAAQAKGISLRETLSKQPSYTRRDIQDRAEEVGLPLTHCNRLLVHWPAMVRDVQLEGEQATAIDTSKLLALLPSGEKKLKKLMIGKKALTSALKKSVAVEEPKPEPTEEKDQGVPATPTPAEVPLAVVEETLARLRWLLRRVLFVEGKPLDAILSSISLHAAGSATVSKIKEAFHSVGVFISAEESEFLMRKFEGYSEARSVDFNLFASFMQENDGSCVCRQSGYQIDVWLQPDVARYRKDEMILQYWAFRKLWRDLVILGGGAHFINEGAEWISNIEGAVVSADDFRKWISERATGWPQIQGHLKIIDFNVLSNIGSASGDNSFSSDELRVLLSKPTEHELGCPLEDAIPQLGDVANVSLAALDMATDKTWEDVSQEERMMGDWPGVCLDGEGRVVSIDWSQRLLTGEQYCTVHAKGLKSHVQEL